MAKHDVVQDGGCWNCRYHNQILVPDTATTCFPIDWCENKKSEYFRHFPVGVGWCDLYQKKTTEKI